MNREFKINFDKNGINGLEGSLTEQDTLATLMILFSNLSPASRQYCISTFTDLDKEEDIKTIVKMLITTLNTVGTYSCGTLSDEEIKTNLEKVIDRLGEEIEKENEEAEEDQAPAPDKSFLKVLFENDEVSSVQGNINMKNTMTIILLLLADFDKENFGKFIEILNLINKSEDINNSIMTFLGFTDN